jgi:WD40 repeat protein
MAASILLRPFFLNAQDKPELVVTTGHIATINAVNFHPAGDFILTAGDDKAVKIWSRSLQQEFRTLYGHTDAVVQAKFSPDGKMIASADRRKLIVWSFPEGKLLRRINVDDQDTDFGFTADGRRVVLNGDNDSIISVNINTGEEIKIVKTSSSHLYVDPKLNLLFDEHDNGDGEDGVMMDVIDLSSGKTLKLVKDVPPNIFRYASCPATKMLAAYADVTNDIALINIESGTVLKKVALKGIVNNNMTKSICFSPDGSLLYVCGYDCGVRVFNVATGTLKTEWTQFRNMGKPIDYTKAYMLGIFMNAIDVSPDGKSVATTLNYITGTPGEIQRNIQSVMLWDASGKTSGELKGMTRRIESLYTSRSKPYLINTNLNPVFGYKLWNLKDGSVEASAQALMFCSASEGADTIVIRIKNKLIVTDLVNNVELFSVESGTANYLSLSGDGKILAVGRVDMSTPGKPESVIDIYDIELKKLRTTIHTGVIGSANFLQVANDKKHVIIYDNAHGFSTWNIASGKKITQVDVPTSEHHVLCQVPGKTSILVSKLDDADMDNFKNRSDIIEYDYLTGTMKSSFRLPFKGWCYSGDFSDDGSKLVLGTGGLYDSTDFQVLVADWSTKQLSCRLEGMYGNVNQVYFGHDGKTVYSGSDDGMIRAWNLDECKQSGTFIGMNDLDYIIFSPDNYYKSSKGNYDGICFRLHNKLYTFEQFDIQYNRPDLVMEKLGAPRSLTLMYKLAWTKRIKRAGFTEEMLSGTLELPDVELPDKLLLPSSTADAMMKLKIKASDKTYTLDRLQVYVNEVPVYGVNGMDLKNKKTKTFEQEVSFELGAGKNLVQVFAVNEKGLESLKESFEIECKKPVMKPDLYILAVGVAKYTDSKYNLKYSSKDMNDFVNAMSASGNYNKVIVNKIQDTAATKENIIAKGKMFADAKVDDHVVIYFSCHGLLDEKMDYYLATTDVVFESPAGRGMPYDEIEKMLDQCKSRNRLVLIDACHSGEVDKEDLEITNEKNNQVVMTKSGGINVKPKAGLKNSFAYMQALFSDVSKGSGAVVISAAAGAEFALESNEWNNGVFTYCIIKGMKNGDADTDKDKSISISELKNYVISHVSELTHGAQVPTVRRENNYNDFTVYRKQ